MMTKNLLKLFFTVIFISILFLSCRTEDVTTENNPATKKSAKKFSIFKNKHNNCFYSKNGDAFDYSNAFAYLSQRYDTINKTNITGLVNTTNIVRHNSTKLCSKE